MSSLRDNFRKPVWDSLPYLAAAMQYYVAGRISFFSGHFPVASNILHHSIELWLKWILFLYGVDEDMLKNKYRHSLIRCLRDVKKLIDDPELQSIGQTVQVLDKWEEIRYPLARKKRKATTVIYHSTDATRTDILQDIFNTPLNYGLSLPEIDRCVATLVKVMRLNPGFLLKELIAEEAREAYWKKNLHASISKELYEKALKHTIFLE